MEIKLHHNVRKALDKINEPNFSRIIKGIQSLAQGPPTGDIKALSGKNKGYRLRIGNYRLLYDYVFNDNGDQIILIYKLDVRGQVYKGD